MRRRLHTRLAMALGVVVAGLGAVGSAVLVDQVTTSLSDFGVVGSPAPGSSARLAGGPSASPTGSPLVQAAAYSVYDTSADCWLAESNADVIRPVGSLMKLLTAQVVLEAGEPDRLVTVPPLDHAADESVIGLMPGEAQRRDVLFRAMLIVSANDAATALAVDVGGTEDAFVDRMNTAARELGLDRTVAANASGLDAPGSGSSARDLVILADELMADDAFRSAVARTDARLHGRTIPSTDRLLTPYPGADGIKTGTTTGAGPSVIGSATRGDRTVIVAVLGAASDDARFDDAATLLDWSLGQPATC